MKKIYPLTFIITSLALIACEESKQVSLDPSAGADVSAGTDEPAGEMSAGEMSAGEMSAGEMSAGEISAGATPPPPPPEECISDLDYFEEQVWRPVIKSLCLDCHNAQGAAQSTDMVYVSEEQLGALETNYAVFSEIAAFDRDGTPLILLKPTNQLAHGGGQLFDVESEAYSTLSEMVRRTRAAEPTVCVEEEPEDHDTLFDGVKLLGPQETLRRATLSLAGRLPSLAEAQRVSDAGWGGVEASLNQLLRSDAFFLRLKEIWNDILLTDKYMGRNNAIDLLNPERFPQARWHLEGSNRPRDEAYWAAQDYANSSLAREALEHIAFVVRHDRPFHEIITSDYLAMNPFTARIYGVDDIEWDDPLDPREYREGRATGIPHSGILSSPMFLNRFPTTDTNRNRHRARIFFKLFLDLDVFKLAERPIDPTSTVHNPTMNDPQCSICHTVIDPVAGSFQHWDDRGSFTFRDTWYGDMRAPGFMDEELPFEERQASLRWLATKASQDTRFDRSITRLMYQALIGSDLLTSPEDGEYFEARQLAFDAQQRFVDQAAAGFRANGHDLRWLIKTLIRSPYYRAFGVEEESAFDEERRAQLQHLGLDKPLTPEQLNRKLYATTGVRWRPRADRPDYLVDEGQFKLLYGGIDSDDVVERIRTPNGIFANIQRRMANEMGCKVAAYDFTRPAEERFLFPWVEPSYQPVDQNGFDIPQVEELMRLNLQHLTWTMWGERYELDSPEIDELYTLWLDVWALGLAEIEAGETSASLFWACRGAWDPETGVGLPSEQQIGNDPRFTIRAWRAVFTVLLTDPAFLYE